MHTAKQSRLNQFETHGALYVACSCQTNQFAMNRAGHYIWQPRSIVNNLVTTISLKLGNSVDRSIKRVPDTEPWLRWPATPDVGAQP
jgi:hypothetical protein